MKTSTPIRTLACAAAVLAAALVLAPGHARAVAITVPNSSFEDPDAAGWPIRNIVNNGPLTNWSIHPWAWGDYVVESGGLTLSNVTGTQFLMLDPGTDSYEGGGGGNWSWVYQNTGAKFAAGTYTLTVDVGYAIGYLDQAKNAGFSMSLVAVDGGGNWTGTAATTAVSSNALASHDGALAPYTLTLVVTNGASYIGQDVLIFLSADSPADRGAAAEDLQNVSLDNVRLQFVPPPPAIFVENASFESPDAAGWGIRNIMNNGPLTGWTPHPWAWSQYVVENGSQTLSGVTGTQFLMLDPATDGYGGASWSLVHQNTGAKFAAGTYTLTVDVGYALGWMAQGKDSGFGMSLVAVDGGGNWTGTAATTAVSSNALASHDGALAPYTLTLVVTNGASYIGQDVLIFMAADSPYQRGSPQAESYWQNVSLDNVRLEFVPYRPTLSIAPSGGNVVVTWSAGWLESTTNLANPSWTTEMGAVSPWTNSPTGPARFYRVGMGGDGSLVTNRPVQIQRNSNVTVDGSLSEWSSQEFVPLDKVYDGDGSVTNDIPEAYYAARWVSNKVYVAVKVRDTYHKFTSYYEGWDQQDDVEIYLHTTGTGSTYYTYDQAAAQQYEIGIMDGTTNAVWVSMGPGLGVPWWAYLEAAGQVDGQWIYYEAALTPFAQFSPYDQEEVVPDILSVGQVIGLDVAVVGRSSSAYTGMKSENLMTGKSENYLKIGRHLLVP